MKRSKLLVISAIALLGFSACQQDEIAPEVTPGETHTVTFVAGAPETKTTVDISDGENAKFAWTAADEGRITVYENGSEAKETVGILGKDGKMTIMAEFAGTATGNETYVAVVNSSNDVQIMSAEAYDEGADILVSKAVSAFDGNNGVQLQFKREVAIAKMTLKGLDAGEVVNHVTVSSIADIAGSYGVDGWNSTKTSLDIYSAKALDDQETYSIVANESGEAVVWFTCIPQADATLTVKVEAADGDTYTKEFSRSITLTRGDVKGFGVAMTKLVDPHKDDNGWFLVKDARFLAAGDVIRIGLASESAVASSLSGDYLTKADATYDDKTESMVSAVSSIDFTLGGTEGAWTLTNEDATLGSTSVKKLALGSDSATYVDTWVITITDTGKASITSTSNTYGTIYYNSSSPRFLNYSDSFNGARVPEIYKKYGTPVVAKVDQNISFSPTNYTATIGAVNTYPSLTAQSTGAKTWSSSNTDVATIDEATGEITLVATGKTTISVSVAGDDTYNEGTGSYELTVKTAQVSEGEWVKTDISEISASDIVVIVGSKYGIRNNEGTSSSPDVVSVKITNDKITSVVPDNIKWNISGNSTDGYVFYPNGDTSKWLYCNTTANSKNNDNIRVGTGARKQWKPDENGYFVNTVGGNQTYVQRVLSINGTSDWRSYINTDTNPQILEFYVLKSSGSSEGGGETGDGETGDGENVSYSIVFKTATSDGSTEISATTESSTVVSEGIDYITSFSSNCSKAYYEGVNGVKLGSSKATGTLEFNLADVVKNNVVSIKVETAKYSSDTGTITMYNGSTELKSGIAPAEGYTHEFASPTTVESLKFVTSSKRAYISKITITVAE